MFFKSEALNANFNKMIMDHTHQYIKNIYEEYRPVAQHDEDCRNGDIIGRPEDQDGYYGCTCGLEKHIEQFIAFMKKNNQTIIVKENK